MPYIGNFIRRSRQSAKTISCKRYLLWICMTFSHFFIAMIVLPDVWLTFLTKKNSERIERRHKLHHLWLSSAHILHICRYQSIYLLLGVFKMLLNAFMIKRLRRFWKHLFYSLCRRDFTQIVFTFYPDDLAIASLNSYTHGCPTTCCRCVYR